MPSLCVAAGSYNYPSETATPFKFPKDPELKNKWTKQVQRTRAIGLPRLYLCSAANISQKIVLNKEQLFVNVLDFVCSV